MKITVKHENNNINLRFPSGLLLNGLTASAVGTMLKRKARELNISGSQLRTLIRAVNKYRRKHKDWVLVEIRENSGETVVIKP